MKEITYAQKIAVLRVLLDILQADGVEDPREVQLFSKVTEQMGLAEDVRTEVENQNSLLALVEINGMTNEQKEEFARLMGQMIVVDEEINYKEVAIYNVVRDFCHIENAFEGNTEF